MDWWILVLYPENLLISANPCLNSKHILASMIYLDSDMSKSTNTVVYFDWKTVIYIYIYVCGKCRTQFMLPMEKSVTFTGANEITLSINRSFVYKPKEGRHVRITNTTHHLKWEWNSSLPAVERNSLQFFILLCCQSDKLNINSIFTDMYNNCKYLYTILFWPAL